MTKAKKEDKKIETIIISEEDYLEDNYIAPSSYYIRDYLGQAVFFKSRDRMKIQKQVDDEHGKGLFKVRIIVKAQAR